MTFLENEYLRVGLRPKGAELTSLLDKRSGIEHLWQADPSVWGWHAPNLFPVVGGCLHNQILVDGKTYPMERHGFARQSVFETTESSATHAQFLLRSRQETMVHFPYAFQFQISYELDGPSLMVRYRMMNEDDKTIYFSVGAHPAFTAPFFVNETYEDYYVAFEKDESLETHILSKEGYFTGETRPIPTDGNRLLLTRHLFDQDALVFKNLASRRVTLGSDKHTHSVTVEYPDFPYLGLWAKPDAPFVCIEPWLGCADSEGTLKPIQEKEAIQQVGVGGVFDASFTITIA